MREIQFPARCWTLMLSVAVAAAVATPGCGGGGDSPAMELCKRLKAADCHLIYMCDEAAALRSNANTGPTEADCISKQQAFCSSQPLCDNGETLNLTLGQQCLDEFQVQTCSASVGTDGGLTFPASCAASCS